MLFGFTGLFGKLIHANPAIIVIGRTVVAVIALLIAARMQRRSLALESRRDHASMVLAGAVLTAHWFAFFRSIQVSSVSVGLLSYSSYPLFVTLLEPLFFREKLRFTDLMSAGLVMAGLAVMTPVFDLGNNVTRGVCWGVVAGLTCALLSLLSRAQVRRSPTLTVTFHQLVWSGLFAVPLVLWDGEMITWETAGLLVVLGTIFTAIPQALFIASLRHLRVHLASVIVGLEPIYAIVFAFFLLSEIPGPRTLLGGALIIGAVLTAMRVPRASAQGSTSMQSP